MPVPSSISDLDENPNNNSPQSSETVGPNANAYLQAAFAFIKQIHDDYVPRDGSEALTASLDAGTQKIINLLAGVDPTDAATVAQVTAVNKIGDLKFWHGAVANIVSVHGAGWQLADGTNGTLDMRGKVPVGYDGGGYTVGATGGSNSITLSVAQMPSHDHSVSDGGHTHVISQSPHGHGVTDPQHVHSSPIGPFLGAIGGIGSVGNVGTVGSANLTNPSSTGISIDPQLANVTNDISATGVMINPNGSGAAIDARMPFMCAIWIEYTG